MFARLVKESFVRNPRRKILTAAALALGIAVATATLSVALEVGDRMAHEFRSLGANLLVTPQADTLPLQIGGVDYRPVNEGAYLNVSDLGKLKMIFWRHNILGFAPFLDVPATIEGRNQIHTTLIGTWFEHNVPVPDGSAFQTGVRSTHPWWKVQGRWFDDDAKECVIGATLAANYPGGIAPGQSIEIAGRAEAGGAPAHPITLAVTGIVATGGAEDNAVLAPLALAQQLAGHSGQFRELFVSALTKPADAFARRDPKTMNETEYDRWYCSPYVSSITLQITQALPGTEVRTIRRVADTEGRVLSRISTLLWIVTLAALAAAILAVAATSAATVLERRVEIGIMKAIGASNSLVSGIFLAEQLMLALIGGAIGYVCGVVLARALGESVFGSPAPVNVLLLPIVLGIAAIVAVIGSLVPLRRAARLDPAPILKGE
ncbi:MAG: ABC transporter permease [Acidobacteriota bacterium]|nr:ABC transporter permease [Acidobacteriota bacterium]MDE3171301.1 ABC transporter permease [Acidobacteriota bacterium]